MKRAILIILGAALMLCACGQGTGSQSGSAEQLTWQEQYDLGVRYLEDGNYEEAIIAFTAAIEIDPKRAETYVGRGDAYVEIAKVYMIDDDTAKAEDNYQSAEIDYLKALDLNQKQAVVYDKLADIYLALGDYESAIAILRKGYEATNDETLLQRIENINILPEDLPVGAIVVTMYDEKGMLIGHDAYSFDTHERMTSNIWYDQDNQIIFAERWIYRDDENITLMERREWDHERKSYENTAETISGCETAGWYWYSINDFLTDPTLKSENGCVSVDDWESNNMQPGSYGQYGYDSQSRVVSIDTFSAEGVLLGHCAVTYTN